MNVAIVTSGYMPVPAALGGAVECLDEYLINENEVKGKCKITVFSAYNKEAEKKAKQLKNTKVKFIKTSWVIKLGDLIIYHIVKFLRPNSKTMSFRYILKRLHFINRVADDLHRNNYDRIMIENHATLLMVMKKKENFKKYEHKYIYHLHNEQNNLYGCEEILKNIKKIATVSGYISNCIKEKLPDLKEEQVIVWRNCVDSTRFGSNEAKQIAKKLKCKYGIKDEEKVILFTGRLSPEKGIKELMQAFEMIHSTNTRLIIAGGYLSGDSKVKNGYEFELKVIAEKMQERIIFAGFVNYSEIPALYEMADVVVIPSIWDDPAPLTVIETITSGVPLITTNSGGIVEYANERCAIILQRDDELISNIAKSLDKLLSDEVLRKRMSESANITSRDWSIPVYYDRFLECIQ